MARTRMFQNAAAGAALMILVAACEDPGLTELQEDLVPNHSVANPLRPFHATLELQALGWSEPPESRCPEGYPALSTMAGTGQVSHLGLASALGTHCINPDDFSFVAGQLTLVAANGDSLYGTYEGLTTYVELPMAGWVDVIVFGGGTGRFRNASGSAEESGEVNLVTGRGTSTVRGALGY